MGQSSPNVTRAAILRSALAVVAIVAGGWFASSAGAAIIFGGPTYDSTTQTGYTAPQLGPSTAGDAVAVGYADKYVSGIDKGGRAVRWDTSGTAATELGNLGTDSNGYTSSGASAINTAGTAVGSTGKYVSGSNMGARAVRWDDSGAAATELGNLGTDSLGSTSNQAFALNTAGTAVGYAEKYVSFGFKGYRAVRWDASGTAATELETLGGDSRAIAINTAGTAVGYAEKDVAGIDNGQCAVRWDASGTAATELGNLGTSSGGATYSQPYTINTVGTAVGYACKYVSGSYVGTRAVRWDASGTAVTELGNLGTDIEGITYSIAYAINTVGIAVGYAEDYDSIGTDLGHRAVAWGPDGVAIDLNTLIDPGSGWVNLVTAAGISDTNWVTGIGSFDPDGPGGQDAYDRMFLLDISSAVPEPAGLSLLALAVPALLRRRRRGANRFLTSIP